MQEDRPRSFGVEENADKQDILQEAVRHGQATAHADGIEEDSVSKLEEYSSYRCEGLPALISREVAHRIDQGEDTKIASPCRSDREASKLDDTGSAESRARLRAEWQRTNELYFRQAEEAPHGLFHRAEMGALDPGPLHAEMPTISIREKAYI